MSERIVLYPAIEKPGLVPVELQGEGTYTYECKSPDCYYCQAMAAKTNDQALVLGQFARYSFWSQEERLKLFELRDRPIKELKLVFGYRSKNSIMNMRWAINRRIKKLNTDYKIAV
jgi:hypothetical protein